MKIFYSKYADNNFMLKSDSSKTSEEERGRQQFYVEKWFIENFRGRERERNSVGPTLGATKQGKEEIEQIRLDYGWLKIDPYEFNGRYQS